MKEDRFTNIADIYEKFRPTYPDVLIEYLYSEVGFDSNNTLADIGSGTGKLTELLLKQGNLVYGVEPNEDMRGVAENVLTNYKNFKSIDASAEETGLADSSVDFITVAQAFHWFDAEKFKLECQRILKNSGKVVLIWNDRDHASTELDNETKLINLEYCPNYKPSESIINEGPEQYDYFFTGGCCDYKIFKYNLSFDEDTFIGRHLSFSHAPKIDDRNYEPYISKLKLLFEKYSDSGILYMPYLTVCYVGKVN